MTETTMERGTMHIANTTLFDNASRVLVNSPAERYAQSRICTGIAIGVKIQISLSLKQIKKNQPISKSLSWWSMNIKDVNTLQRLSFYFNAKIYLKEYSCIRFHNPQLSVMCVWETVYTYKRISWTLLFIMIRWATFWTFSFSSIPVTYCQTHL